MRDAAEIAREVMRLFWVDDANRPSWLPDRINDRLVARIAAAIEKGRAVRWQPIETAPRDGTPVLLLLKNPLPVTNRPDLDGWHGIAFVGRNPVSFDYPYWNFAAPVGQGGFPDEWIAGWQPLPIPPAASPPAAVYCAPCGKEHGGPPCQPV